MISFIMEKESNEQISFLDTLVSRKYGFIVIDVFRKLTHTDRYFDFNSHHEKKHKIRTVSTLLNRACNLPYTLEGNGNRLKLITSLTPFLPTAIYLPSSKTKPSPELIPSPQELVALFFNLIGNKSTAMTCLSYVRGVTETLTRLLRKNGINFVTRPHKT